MTGKNREAVAERRRYLWIVGAILCSVSCQGGCQPNVGPEILPRYSPIHPADGTPIVLRFRANDPTGIASARVSVYERELFTSPTGVLSARQRQGGLWGSVQQWTYSGGPTQVDQQYTIAAGFPAATDVTFTVEVVDSQGMSSAQSWSFAAGTWPFGNSPIPIWGNGAPANRIDVAFVADQGDYATARNMLPDLEGLIFDGYHTNDMVRQGFQIWQFYYSPERGTISDFNAGAPFTLTIPASVSNSTIIDHAAVIHTTTKRDWASGGNFGTEPANIGTAVHESAHVAFDLEDEYAGGGHSTSARNHHNNFDSEASCRSYNRSHRWPEADCENIEGSWWRPEPSASACIMFDDGDASMPKFGRTCRLRVDATYWTLDAAYGTPP